MMPRQPAGDRKGANSCGDGFAAVPKDEDSHRTLSFGGPVFCFLQGKRKGLSRGEGE